LVEFAVLPPHRHDKPHPHHWTNSAGAGTLCRAAINAAVPAAPDVSSRLRPVSSEAGILVLVYFAKSADEERDRARRAKLEFRRGIMNLSSIPRRLVALASAMLGFVRGGPAMVTV
jgi:hypothetical protein